MKFCSNCATALVFGAVDNEHLPRFYCSSCGVIHYQNPKIIVACLPIWENKIMLCRRGIEHNWVFGTFQAVLWKIKSP